MSLITIGDFLCNCTKFQDMKMNPEYGHQINPISRLMQVMQARKQNEPKFQLVAERGQSRYKEFVMEVCFAYYPKF